MFESFHGHLNMTKLSKELNKSTDERIKKFFRKEEKRLSAILCGKKVKFETLDIVYPIRKDIYGHWVNVKTERTGIILSADITMQGDGDYKMNLIIVSDKGRYRQELSEVKFI
jgi:hypothetical protein